MRVRDLRRVVLQCAALVAGGAVLGLGLNAANPHPVSLGTPVYAAAAAGTASCSDPAQGAAPDEHPRITLGEAVGACQACSAGFVDARGADAFAHGHIAGAVHLPPWGHPDEGPALQELRRFSSVIVYDDAGGCRLARAVADRLRAQGFRDVRLLDLTWTEWTATGGPAESGACRVCEHGAESHP